MKNTVETTVSSRAPDEDTLLEWVKREAIPFMAESRDRQNTRYEREFTHTSTLTAAFETAYTSPALPTDSSWEVDALVLGRATDGSTARYHIQGSFKRSSGDASKVGATLVLAQIEDVAGWDCDFGLSGQTVLVQVKGDVTRTVAWTVMVQIRES